VFPCRKVRTVLVVEDHADVRAMLTQILSEEGYRVLEANDGVEALEVITAEHRIDLVLSDIVMPRMDGFQLAAQLAPPTRLLLMTGHGKDHWNESPPAPLLTSRLRLTSCAPRSGAC
jgi:CheY-like chemotaxis protein